MNQKGGVGKTTTVVNLSAALALRGFRVLIVDCDPQANASTHLGIDIHAGNPSLYDVLTQGMPMSECIVSVATNLDIVPSELDLAGAEVELVSAMGRETLLRDALERLEREGGSYDFVFLDCPPSLGLLPSNALAAASEVIIVLQAEFFALQGISQLSRFIDLVIDRINPGLEVSTVVTCMYDSRTRFSREVIDDISQHFGDRMLETFIRRNVKLAEASSHGVSVFDYDAACPGAQDYAALADEFLALRPDLEARAIPAPRTPRRRSSRKSATNEASHDDDPGSSGPQHAPVTADAVPVAARRQQVVAATIAIPSSEARVVPAAETSPPVTDTTGRIAEAAAPAQTRSRGLVLTCEDELLGL
jgi:chromosome partitioning protein